MATTGASSSKNTSPLNKQAILQRIEDGRAYMRPFADKMCQAAKRYRDAAGLAWSKDDGGAQSQAVGEVNKVAINIRQLTAAIAFGTPDFIVKCGQQDNAEIVRAFVRDTWESNLWTRLVRMPLLMHFLGGMGWLAELWDPVDGYTLEHVHPRDLAYDPHTFDAIWNRPRWAARRVWIPQDTARDRYGAKLMDIARVTAKDAMQQQPSDLRWNSRPDSKDDAISVWTYWDRQNEVEVFGGEILPRENLYGRVPLLVHQGELNPEGDFALGHYDQCLGAAEQVRRLQNVFNDLATNGAGIPWVNTDYIHEDAREAYLAGEWTGPVPVTGVKGSEAFGYTGTVDMPNTLIDALQYLSQGVDEDQGVNAQDRGSMGDDPKFATQAVLVAQRSTARSSLLRKNFEAFCNRIIRNLVKDTVRFGLDPNGGEPSPQAVMVWEALQDVKEIRIVEESTSWIDPTVEQQNTATTYNLVMQHMQTFIQLAQVGLIDEIPNPVPFLKDMLRAQRRQQMDRYFINMNQSGGQPLLAALLGGQVNGTQGAPEAQLAQLAQAQPGQPAEAVTTNGAT